MSAPRRLHLLALGLSGAVAACNFAPADISASDIPPNPVFWTDVLPLLDDHCTLCHGYPTNYGAPSGFRLDQYGHDAEHKLRGAKEAAGEFWEEIKGDAMPPAAAWGDGMGKNGKKLIELWIKQGARECMVATDCPESNQTCTSAHLCRK